MTPTGRFGAVGVRCPTPCFRANDSCWSGAKRAPAMSGLSTNERACQLQTRCEATMTQVWAQTALWLGLALVATLFSIWLKVATALSEIVDPLAAHHRDPVRRHLRLSRRGSRRRVGSNRRAHPAGGRGIVDSHLAGRRPRRRA